MTNNLQNIYNAPIISEGINALWDDNKVAPLAQIGIVVLSQPFEDNSPEAILLHKMLAACKLNNNEYTIIQLAQNERIAWHLLKEKTKAQKILLFGILPLQMGISALMQLNVVNNFDQAKWLPTATLAQINNTNGLKQELWTKGLKSLFSL